MSIRVKYFLFIGLIHLLITYLSFYLLKEQKAYFILTEVGILFSLYLSFRLYAGFIKPLQFMSSGVDAILDKDYSVHYLPTNSKELNKLIDVYNQMIDNIRNERTQLEEQHYFLQRLISASPAGIILLDYDDNISDINPKAKEILEIKNQAVPNNLADIQHPLIAGILSLTADKTSTLTGKGIERFKCELSYFVHRGFKRKFILIQELSKEIVAAEKRAYGKVIRMMAHEVNNSIGAINSILGSTIEELPSQDEEDQLMLKEALEVAVDRNKSLTLFMKNFAEVVRLPPPKPEWIKINQLVRNIAQLMEPKARENDISFEYKLLRAEETKIHVDIHQFEQALVNIVKNSIEAIGQDGTIKFIVQAHPMSIIIADNGSGIAPNVADKLFTPFFSTKPTGQGVGLTLVKEIVMNHNAHIELETREDGWTYCEIGLGG
ncbi:MAG: ATP-binding protein [Bacteroidota bacterium]